MPVDRPLAEDLAQTLVELYGDTQTRLAADVARRLAAGMEAPDWAQQKLAQIGQLQRFAQRLLGALAEDMTGEVQAIILAAYQRGGEAALEELAKLGGGTARDVAAVRATLPGTGATQRLVYSLVSKLQGTHLRILRETVDVYRQVVATAGAPDVLAGLATRRRAAQVVWERFLTRGVTGFVDKAGRNWELASYVEMAARTGVAQAAVEGHLDRLAAAGLDLVIVSNAPQECARCRPWEGKVLARGGPGGKRTVELEHATRDGETVRVEVAGSVAEAVADGLMHPNCRHSLSAYLPGVTKSPTHTEDPEGDAARQQQRHLERKVREWKRKAAAAIDPAAAKAASARAREYQAQIRAHLDENPGLFRKPEREQLGIAR